MSKKEFCSSLSEKQIITLNGLKDVSLTCISGKVWVTGAENGDMIIENKASCRMKVSNKLIIEGMTPSDIRVTW